MQRIQALERVGDGKRPWAALLTLFLGSACHESAQFHRVQAAAVIDEAALDFGQVPVGEWRNAEIHIRNVGYAPFNALDALKVGTDSSFLVGLDPGKVQPGETKAVRVRFHPLKEGSLSFDLKVQTDADRSPEQAIPVRGVGTPALVTLSPAVTDFQNVEIDS